MLCQFLVYSKMIPLYSFSYSFPLWLITGYGFPCAIQQDLAVLEHSDLYFLFCDSVFLNFATVLNKNILLPLNFGICFAKQDIHTHTHTHTQMLLFLLTLKQVSDGTCKNSKHTTERLFYYHALAFLMGVNHQQGFKGKGHKTQVVSSVEGSNGKEAPDLKYCTSRQKQRV